MAISQSRWGCWETNSSTMNQIAICKISGDESKERIPREIVITGKVEPKPYYEEMFSLFEEKCNIIMGTIYELRNYELGSKFTDYTRAVEVTLNEDIVNKCEYTFFEVLNRQGIKYSIEADEDTYHGFIGMSGVTDGLIKFLLDTEKVRYFLFNPNSMYTFGENNAFPLGDKVGYTDKNVADYELYSI